MLYRHGRQFRSHHVTDLLLRLQHVELAGGNAPARRRTVTRLMAEGLRDSLAEQGGDTLASCLAAFSHLDYAPAGIVGDMCGELLRVQEAGGAGDTQ